MVILYKDPKGEKIFEHGKSQGTLNVTSDDTKIEQYNDLEKYCIELEGRLRKHEVSMTMCVHAACVNVCACCMCACVCMLHVGMCVHAACVHVVWLMPTMVRTRCMFKYVHSEVL